MKLATVFALTGAGFAAAFAPSTPAVRKNAALSMSFVSELGAQRPLGYWDPLNFCYGVDQERFDRLRFVELKHGRISMLAVLGHVTTAAGVRLPGSIDLAGDVKFSDIPTGFDALSKIP